MGTVRSHRAAKRGVRKTSRRTKDKKREINIASNPIIAENWDYNLTLKQNYKKLGLTAKLGTAAGGQEKSLEKPVYKKVLDSDKPKKSKKTSIQTTIDEDEQDENKIPLGEARIIRDEKGDVIKVIYGKMKPLDDDLNLVNAESAQQAEEPKTEVVRQLEEYARAKSGVRKERKLSSREDQWLENLYDKYGDDYDKMKWDKKLNQFQLSPGELRRRILKWKKKHNVD